MSAKGKNNGVGFGRPPVHTRFQKGQTGNARGRPKGSKNLATQFFEAVGQTVPVTQNGRSTRMTKLQATIQQLVNKGAQGDPRAMAQVLDWVADLEARAEQANMQTFNFTDADREVIVEIYRRLAQPPQLDDYDARA